MSVSLYIFSSRIGLIQMSGYHLMASNQHNKSKYK